MVFVNRIPSSSSKKKERREAIGKSDQQRVTEAMGLSYHFFKMILEASVPVCAAINFLRSPTVSSGLHLTRTKQKTQETLYVRTQVEGGAWSKTNLYDLADHWR